MPSLFFLDTNIFIYAHDQSDEIKTNAAQELITKAHKGQGVISDQIVREFCNVATKKFSILMSTDDIIDTIKTELQPLLLASSLDESLYEDALRLKDRYGLSFYDSAILQMAIYLKCNVIYSEDMKDGETYGTIKVVNPFL